MHIVYLQLLASALKLPCSHSIQKGTSAAAQGLLCLILLLAAGMPAGLGLTLCRGEGGHLEIEHAGRCGLHAPAQAPLPQASQVTDLDEHSSPCGPCTDIPLVADASTSSTYGLLAASPRQDVACVSFLFRPDEALLPLPGRAPPAPRPQAPFRRPSPLPLRTVVLLI